MHKVVRPPTTHPGEAEEVIGDPTVAACRLVSCKGTQLHDELQRGGELARVNAALADDFTERALPYLPNMVRMPRQHAGRDGGFCLLA